MNTILELILSSFKTVLINDFNIIVKNLKKKLSFINDLKFQKKFNRLI